MGFPSAIWHRLTTSRAVDEDQALREYMAKVIMVMIGAVSLFLSVVVAVGIPSDTFSFQPLLIFLLILMHAVIGWLLVDRGQLRWGASGPIGVFLLLSFFSVYALDAEILGWALGVLALLLTALLYGAWAQWVVVVILTLGSTAMIWVGGERYLDAVLNRLITMGATLSGVALLQWLALDLLQAALTRARNSAAQLCEYQTLLEERVVERTAALARANEELQQEIVERQNAEQALRQARDELEMRVQERTTELSILLEAATAVSSTLDLEEVLTLIAERVVKAVDAAGCCISRLDRATDSLVTWIMWWRKGAGSGETGPLSYALADLPTTRAVLETRRPATVLVGNPTADSAEVVLLRMMGCTSLLMLPLAAGEQIIGLLELYETGDERCFSDDEIRLCQALADQAAVVIRNAQLYNMAQQEVIERRQAEDALRASEERFRQLAAENARLLEQARHDMRVKEALLHEVNHRVKNNLAAIVGLLYAEQRYARAEEQLVYAALLTELTGRVQGMATVHTMLSAAGWAPLPLNELARQVIHAALQGLPRGKHLQVDVSPSSLTVSPDQANSLALVINELATNTVKYALVEQDAVRIAVNIVQQDQEVLFEFRNDGPGYPPRVLQLLDYNVGLYLVHTVVEGNLRGKVELRNDPGPVTAIRFPL